MSISVLLADDHTVLSEGLRFLIETQDDLRVVGSATDGRSAVNMARKLKPQVVVMDISMPDLNGIEATRLLCERSNGIGVVILSMHSNQEYVLRALRAGARGYLLKKSAGKEVVDAIRAVYLGGRYLSPEVVGAVIDDYLRDRPVTDPLDALSARERQILQLVVEGKSNGAIARSLSLSPKTVDTYRSRLMQKLNLDSVSALVKFAIQQGLTTIE
jgi:DNA-binding NarL/FixJ family response regulator